MFAKPDRRALLRGAATSAIIALNTAFIARAAAGRVLKIGYVYVRDSQLGAGAVAFANQIEAATGGAYRIEHYPNGVLGGEVAMLEGLRKGELDLGFISTSAICNFVPSISLFDLPFLFRDATHARAVLDSPIGQAYLGKRRDLELIGLA